MITMRKLTGIDIQWSSPILPILMWLARNGSSELLLYPERRLYMFRLSFCPLSLSNAYSSRIVNFQNENMVAGITDTPAAFIKKSISPTLSFTRYIIRNVTSIVATHPFQKPPSKNPAWRDSQIDLNIFPTNILFTKAGNWKLCWFSKCLTFFILLWFPCIP